MNSLPSGHNEANLLPDINAYLLWKYFKEEVNDHYTSNNDIKPVQTTQPEMNADCKENSVDLSNNTAQNVVVQNSNVSLSTIDVEQLCSLLIGTTSSSHNIMVTGLMDQDIVIQNPADNLVRPIIDR